MAAVAISVRADNDMKTLQAVAAVLVGLCSGCDGTQPPIEGVWELQDGGSGPYSFTQFSLTSDGRKCVVTFDSIESEVITTAYLNRWEVIDGVLVTTYGPNTSGSMPPGYVMHDRIDALTEDQLELFMIKPAGWAPELHRKLPAVDPERICELAKKIVSDRSEVV